MLKVFFSVGAYKQACSLQCDFALFKPRDSANQFFADRLLHEVKEELSGSKLLLLKSNWMLEIY